MNNWLRQKHRYHFHDALSPTYFNLSFHLQNQCWSKTHFPALAHLTEQHFAFDEQAAKCLEFKHLLAALTTEYCSETMPETYIIDDTNWISILNQLADKHYTKGYVVSDTIDDFAWILKPSLLNNGQHIKLFHRLSEIESHYFSSNRLGNEHVLQRYLKPDLSNGKKYSIRVFVVITNDQGAYLYRDGYYNEAIHIYKPHQYNDLCSHLTNEHLLGDAPNVIQHPTIDWHLFPSIYPQIKDIVTKVIHALKQQYPQAFIKQKKRTMALFGFDFMLDDTKRLWLLEANHGPCFPIEREHPLQSILYDPFWKAFIRNFIIPIVQKNVNTHVQTSDFEEIN